MPILELAAAGAAVTLAPDIGGAITAFTVDGVPFLRPTPPAALAEADVRRTACYPLVPYSNRIANGVLHFAEREFRLARNVATYPHAIHGVGWQRAWSVVGASNAHALVALRHDATGVDADAWPWPFLATQAFHLVPSAHARAAVLAVTLSLANVGDEPFPFGLGWHPHFPRDEATELGFAAREVFLNDQTQLPVARVAVPAQWRFDPARALGAPALDNVFAGWGGEATIIDRARATSLAADRACAFVVVYAPAHRPFFAVEPVTHQTDAFNRAAAGETRTGTRVLPPGAAFSCTMRIAATVNPARASLSDR
ncbi:MAG: aldose 1-epimerase [Rudaea sp.]